MRVISSFGTIALTAAGIAAMSSSSFSAIIYGVSSSNNLLQFNSATPATIDSSVAITGLQGGEDILGIDFRPATGQLYALGNSNRLYTINPNTGAATAVGAGLGLVLNGTQFGFDFNPQIDAIRIVSETDRNYVANPNTGTAAQFTNLFYAAGDPNVGANPNVVGSAYNNNNVGTASTQLFGIDTNLDILVTQANSAGTLGTVGPLGVNASAVLGFDVETGTNIAFAAIQPAGGSVSNLYTINLGTGAATNIGEIDGGLSIVAMTVAIPEPASLSLLGAAGLFVIRRRK